MKLNKSISYTIVWNVLSRFLLQGITFFTTPVFLRLLSPEDYGSVAVYNTWMVFIGVFMGMQTYGSIPNARVAYSEKEINSYLSAIMTISLIAFGVILVVFLSFFRVFVKFIDLRYDVVLLLLFHCFFSFVVFFYTTKLIQFKQVEKNFIISLVLTVSSVLLSIFLVFFAENDKYVGRIYGIAIPQIIAGIILLFIIYNRGKLIYDKRYWSFCLPLVLPLLLHAGSGIVLAHSDRIMLDKMIDKTAVGIYSLGYTLALVLDTLWGAFNTSWVPFYYDYKKDNRIDLILQKSNNYMLIFSVITIGFILLAPEVYKLIAPKEYWSGIYIIPLIAISYYLNFLYAFPANHEFFNKKTGYISLGTFFSSIINIGLNFILIPHLGIIGAALTTIISFFFMFLFHDVIARFIVKDFEYRFSFYLTGLCPVILFTVLYFFTLDYWLIRWGLGFLLGCFILLRIIKNKAIF